MNAKCITATKKYYAVSVTLKLSIMIMKFNASMTQHSYSSSFLSSPLLVSLAVSIGGLIVFNSYYPWLKIKRATYRASTYRPTRYDDNLMLTVTNLLETRNGKDQDDKKAAAYLKSKFNRKLLKYRCRCFGVRYA